MKKIFFLLILLSLTNCTTNDSVYWCGDHPCINKKEKEAYFKKTMIVELRSLNNKDGKKKSEIDKIMEEARSKEKIRIRKEKDLSKQEKIDEKKRIKEEKRLAKKIKSDEKKRIKEEKKLAKSLKSKKNSNQINEQNSKNVQMDIGLVKAEIETGKFIDIVEKIIKRNNLKEYPNINDTPD